MEIRVPTINNNDEDALLVQWLVEDLAKVEAGTIVAELETSKSSYELKADSEGFLKQLGEEGERYRFGAVIGILTSSEEELASADTEGSDEPNDLDGLILTESARAAMAEHGITPAQVRALGKKVIKSEDLTAFISDEQGGHEALSTMQQSIARVVSRSHAEIPSAFILKKVYCDSVLDWITPYAQEQGVMLSLPDLMVYHVSRLWESEPRLFAALVNEETIHQPNAAHIGITFDLGKGLFIPVIQQAQERSLVEIARAMTSFRRKAMRNKFNSDDLEGANFSISLNMDVDTVCVRPIIPHGQTAMLSMGALLSECVLEDGAPAERKYLNLGLVYDHRVVNGYEANAFVNRIKQRWEGSAEDLL